jgi:hypothetical protein
VNRAGGEALPRVLVVGAALFAHRRLICERRGGRGG